MLLLLQLFTAFFKTGLFAIGGGLATLPFLYEMSEKTGWFSVSDIANLVAVSEATPGPMGVNMATYVGYISSGIFGSIIATLGLIAPSIVIIVIISRFLKKFKNNRYVQYVFYGLRAASTALIAAAGISIAQLAFLKESGAFGVQAVDWVSLVLAGMVFIGFRKWRLHPIMLIICSAVIGIFLQI